MDRSVALTGATGFIGSTLLRRLHADGWRVRALVRARTRPRSLPPAAQWITGSLEDPAALARLVSGVDAVIHCAGAVRGASSAQFERVNAAGVAALVRVAAAQERVPRFLLLSSLAAREPTLSPYAASKRHGEQALDRHGETTHWTVLRPPAVYGPGDRELLPLLRWMARGWAVMVGDRSARFSLLYVEDLAAAIVHWLEQPPPAGTVLELDDGRAGGYCWADVVAVAARWRGRRVRQFAVPAAALDLIAAANLRAARLLGYAPMLTPWKLGELRHADWVCKDDAARRAFAWRPRVSLADGIELTLRSFRG